MAEVDKKKKLRPSIFDRLLDDSPDSQSESEADRTQVIRSVRESVRRDLENLLNTRFRILSAPDECPELDQSLVNYGLPDLATINFLDVEASNEFCRNVERTIRKYEPRFKSAKVKTLENADPNDRTVRFRIDAVLYADPAPQIIIFDSVLEPVTRTVDVKEVDTGLSS